MTVTIRISKTGAPQPANGFVGAMGGTTPGASTDVEITDDAIKSVDAAIAFVTATTSHAAAAFVTADTGLPAGEVTTLDGELVGDALPPFGGEEKDEPLIEADVLDYNTAGIDERAEKARRKEQRKRVAEIIDEMYGRSDTSFAQDRKDIAKALEAEGIIR